MKLTRRRFLTISAAFAALPAHANSWHGRAFGADVSITIRGPRDLTELALNQARDTVRTIEKLFNLYNPSSDLSKLNGAGFMKNPKPHFSALMRACDHAYHVTNGLFDPTVQPLWKALASSQSLADKVNAVGWNKVTFTDDLITLGANQAVTFNGIAQGFATDLVADGLSRFGLKNALVNMGEYHGSGGPWTIGLSDPIHGHLGTRTVSNGAVATSSPSALSFGEHAHILHPNARPQWSTVSVEAETATLADSMSTALVLASREQIEAVRKDANLHRITLVNFDSDLITI